VKFLLDESAIIDFFEARDGVSTWLLKLSPKEVGLPAVAFATLQERSHREEPATRGGQLRELLSALPIVQFGRIEATKAGELGAWARRAGREIDLSDLATAATAITHGAVLVTVRAGVFVDIPDLRVDVR
jgi:predicted nucleic acid-binding protein